MTVRQCISISILGAACCALLTAPVLTAQAVPAAAGQKVYTAQCASCHGQMLEGGSGPPLAGTSFLSNWSGRSALALVDKIQKTMPFGQPAALTRAQSIELAALILKSSKVSQGPGGLSEARLVQITFPTVRNAKTAQPEGNLAEIMRAIAYPNSNILFNLQIKNPSAETKKPVAGTFDYVEWGSTIYTGWLAVDQAAIALVETAPLLLTPGRRCQNGKLAPVERADWKQYVASLVSVGKLALQASRERNFEAFGDISEKLNEACANCHQAYRDKGGTEGSGATRCQ